MNKRQLEYQKMKQKEAERKAIMDAAVEKARKDYENQPKSCHYCGMAVRGNRGFFGELVCEDCR